MTARMYRRWSALFLLLCCGLARRRPPDGSRDLHWVSTWGTAQQLAVETLPTWVVPPPREPNEPPPPALLPPYPSSFRDETVRMIVRTSAGGDSVRLTLSNALGMDTVRIGAVHVAVRERDSAIVAATDRTVTFGGRASLSVEPGALVVSDTIELSVPALTELAVSLYLPNETRGVTTHEFALNTTYVGGRQCRRRSRVAERGDESHVLLVDRSRGARPGAGGRDRSVRRFDYRRRLDDAGYAPSVAGATRREVASEPRNEPLGCDQCRDFG